MHVKNAQDGSFNLDWLRCVSREKAKYGFVHRVFNIDCFIGLLYSFLWLLGKCLKTELFSFVTCLFTT